MIAVALKTDDACFFPSTVLYLRVSAAAVEVVTTQGTARFESNHPRYLLRDLMGGRINVITTGLKIGQSPMDYTVHSSTLAKRHTHNPSVGAAVPENMPLPKRVILFETVAFGDYHPFDSLEIVGIKRNGNLVFGLVDTTYELTFPLDADARKVFRAAVAVAAARRLLDPLHQPSAVDFHPPVHLLRPLGGLRCVRTPGQWMLAAARILPPPLPAAVSPILPTVKVVPVASTTGKPALPPRRVSKSPLLGAPLPLTFVGGAKLPIGSAR